MEKLKDKLTELNLYLAPYLIQRLKLREKPATEKDVALNNMSRMGSLTKTNKQEILRFDDMFIFEYMGSAEFEFGAVSDTICRIANHADSNYQIYPVEDVRNYEDKPLQLYCAKEQADFLKLYLYELSLGRIDLKEPSRIELYLKGYEPKFYEKKGFRGQTPAWLNLDERFGFFFTFEENLIKLVPSLIKETAKIIENK